MGPGVGQISRVVHVSLKGITVPGAKYCAGTGAHVQVQVQAQAFTYIPHIPCIPYDGPTSSKNFPKLKIPSLLSAHAGIYIKSIRKFIEHYGSYDALQPPLRREQEISLAGVASEVESRMAALLGKPKLSKTERACVGVRGSPEQDIERAPPMPPTPGRAGGGGRGPNPVIL